MTNEEKSLDEMSSNELEEEYNNLLKEQIREMRKEGSKNIVEYDNNLEIFDSDANKGKDDPSGVKQHLLNWGQAYTKQLAEKGYDITKDYYQKEFEQAYATGDDVSEWVPTILCQTIWQGKQCMNQLANVVTVRSCDINQGEGNSVKLRTIAKNTLFNWSGNLTRCQCAPETSDTFSAYTLTLRRFDVYKKVCNLDIFKCGDELRDAMVKASANVIAASQDKIIYDALRLSKAGYYETASASFTCSLGYGGVCCSYAADLYKNLLSLRARMVSDGYGPNFYLILGPRVANFLKFYQGLEKGPASPEVEIVDNTLIKMGDVKIVEYCKATDCSDSYGVVRDFGAGAKLTVAILIDADRAIGEAYGKRPYLKISDEPIECDAQKIVWRMYWSRQVLDYQAIGKIYNP